MASYSLVTVPAHARIYRKASKCSTRKIRLPNTYSMPRKVVLLLWYTSSKPLRNHASAELAPVACPRSNRFWFQCSAKSETKLFGGSNEEVCLNDIDPRRRFPFTHPFFHLQSAGRVRHSKSDRFQANISYGTGSGVSRIRQTNAAYQPLASPNQPSTGRHSWLQSDPPALRCA